MHCRTALTASNTNDACPRLTVSTRMMLVQGSASLLQEIEAQRRRQAHGPMHRFNSPAGHRPIVGSTPSTPSLCHHVSESSRLWSPRSETVLAEAHHHEQARRLRALLQRGRRLPTGAVEPRPPCATAAAPCCCRGASACMLARREPAEAEPTSCSMCRPMGSAQQDLSMSRLCVRCAGHRVDVRP